MGDPYGKIYKALESFTQKGSTPESKAKTMEAIDKMKSLLAKQLKRINYAYLRSVFFPEFTKGGRFPTKFPQTTNTYSVRSTFTVKLNSNSFGLMVNPFVVSNSIPAIYVFNSSSCSLDTWGDGKPMLYNGKPSGQDVINPSINTVSSEFYFTKSRLIGASVIVQPVNYTGGVFRGACEYDVSLSPSALNEAEVIKDVKTQEAFTNFFSGYSFDLYRALKKTEPFLEKLKEELAKLNSTTYELDALLRTVAGSIAFLTVEEYENNRSLTLTENAPGIFTRMYQYIRGKKDDRTQLEKGKTPKNDTFHYVILGRALAQMGWKPYSTTTKKTGVLVKLSAFKTDNSTVSGEIQVDKSIDEAKRYLNLLSTRWGVNHAESISRLTRELTGSAAVNLSSTNFPGGVLNFERLSECHYFHDNKASEGVRVIWVPNKEPEWSDVATDIKDMLLIGGEGLSTNTLVTISIVRHFEGVTVPGLKDIFPGVKEFPDERVVRLVSAVHTLYPQILDVPVPNLADTYQKMKKTFKWFDLIVSDRGGYMEMTQELPISTDNLGSSAVQQMISAPSMVEEID